MVGYKKVLLFFIPSILKGQEEEFGGGIKIIWAVF